MTPENLNDWIDLCRVQGLKLQAQAALIRKLGEALGEQINWDGQDFAMDGTKEALAAYDEWLKRQDEKT